MIVRNGFSVVALWGTLVFFAGCGEKMPDGLPKLHPTLIEVTADGEKLSGASVSLYPVAGGETAGASTDAKGVAKINTRGKYDGAPAGKYKVCVSWAVTIDGPTSKKPVPTDPAELEKYKTRVIYERTSKPALVKEYRDQNTTPLEVEVVEGKNNFSVEVELTDEGKRLKAEAGI